MLSFNTFLLITKTPPLSIKHFLRERECERGERCRGKVRESYAGSMLIAEPDAGEPKSRVGHSTVGHPGAPETGDALWKHPTFLGGSPEKTVNKCVLRRHFSSQKASSAGKQIALPFPLQPAAAPGHRCPAVAPVKRSPSFLGYPSSNYLPANPAHTAPVKRCCPTMGMTGEVDTDSSLWNPVGPVPFTKPQIQVPVLPSAFSIFSGQNLPQGTHIIPLKMSFTSCVSIMFKIFNRRIYSNT